VNIHLLELAPKILSIYAVAISDETSRSSVPRNGLKNLASCLFCGGVFGHVEVDVATPILGQNYKDEQYAQSDCWHREEIDRDQIS
jgi:hypothetical protein